MNVTGAKILKIGEIQKANKGYELLSIDVQTPLSGKRTFTVIQNRNPKFDLVKKFRNEVFKEGQTIDFNFNKAEQSWQFDSIWDIKIRNNINE